MALAYAQSTDPTTDRLLSLTERQSYEVEGVKVKHYTWDPDYRD